MGQIKVEKNVGNIEGLCVITPAVHGDDRGYFMETYSQRDMEENGIEQIDELSLVLEVYDSDTYSTIFKTNELNFNIER